jgi:hypothetical protein
LKFIRKICLDLNLEIPESFVDAFNKTLQDFRQTPSPKFDKFYQIRTFYESFINERHKQAA